MSNSFLVNAGGYHGFGAEGTSDLAIMGNIAIGVAFDRTVGMIQGLPKRYTSAQVSRFKSLSYKPKYAAQFREYLIKQKISEGLSSVPGTIGTGVANNAASIDIKDDKKTK